MAGAWVIRRHWWVTSGCVILFVVFAAGLPSVNTSVNLLKLFHPEAKIIRDYRWIEENLSYLVPMELLIAVDKEFQRLPLEELEKLDPADRDIHKENLQLNFLERAELANRVQQIVEDAFGPEGEKILGRGLSAPKFLPPFPGPNGASSSSPRSAHGPFGRPR